MFKRLLPRIGLCAALFTLLACGGESGKKETLRYRFDRILDIAYTPNAATRCGGWFVDQGSWMGFTLPEADLWTNGFCGPFSLDSRRWLARTAVKTTFATAPGEVFTPDSTNYIPGKVFLSAHSGSGTIHQHLEFADASTALLTVRTDGDRELCLTGEGWAEGTTFKMYQNQVIARHPSGEMTCISFTPDARVTLTEDNYQAICTADPETHVAISFFYKEKEKTAGRQKAALVVGDPVKVIRANEERWEGYLSQVLRDDMPAEYDRVAAKAVVTLLSNWKTHKGSLLHEGVVPSHAVGYFMGFWAWDSWKHAVALAAFAPELAKNQIRAMLDYQLSDGMVIDCIYSDPEENNDRDSKPPLTAWAVDAVYKHTGDLDFLREMYPHLLTYHRWWYAKRDHNGNGICEFGSTDGTAEAAAWESGMDNAIRFDNATMVRNGEDAWSFDQESIDLNAFLALEYKLLKKFAGILEQPFDEPDRTSGVADYFFDNERGFFFDRRLSDGSFIHEESSEAYIPIWTGIATPEQVERAMTLLTDPNKFSTYIPFPTAAADNPKFLPKGYWRGPIWLDQTYFAINGLRNYGYNEQADEYTRQVFDRLDGLTASAPIHENYGTHTGERLKAPHFSWSAAHLLMLYQEYGK